MALWGKTDVANSAPKSLSAADKEKTYLVDETEAKVSGNREKGIKTPGWVKYEEYTDSNGAVRHKAETLVPMRVKAITAGDADDDDVIPDTEV